VSIPVKPFVNYGKNYVDKSFQSNKITVLVEGMPMKKVNKKGITLIELIVVMVIIAIGALLLAPNIGGWLPGYRLRSAIRDVASTLRVAQMKAVSTNMEYRVSFNNPVAGSYVLQRHTGGIWVDEGAAQTLPTGIIISGVTFPVDGGWNCAEFNPNSTSSTGSITLQNTKGSQRRITLTTSTGRVKID
jgi:prepilin-type N-terminal cleavage/methylation domain-containing protein